MTYAELHPITDDSLPRERSVETLVRIATFQRHLNLAILGNMMVASFVREVSTNGGLFVAALSGVVAVIASWIAAFRLADALYGRNRAIVCGVLMLVPGIHLITLLVLSRGATNRLRDAGIRVGLLGASPDDVRSALGAAA